MKKTLLTVIVAALAAVAAHSQNYMVVNTETIFKSLPAYTKAVEEIDATAQQYQTNIDNAYEQLEEMYQKYMSQRESMSQSDRQQREQTILNNEERIAAYQEEVFGEDGKIMKLQQEKLEPYRQKIMEVIADYAKTNGYGLVLDIATNPLVIYYAPSADKTEQIIAILKK